MAEEIKKEIVIETVEVKEADKKPSTDNAEAKKAESTRPSNNRNSNNRDNRNSNNRDRKGGKPRFERPKSDFEEKVISIRRVVKVVKGGRRFRFSALVVVGNKKGQVGYGFGKSNEVPDAIKKAIKDAKKNLINVTIVKPNDTVSCDWIAKHDASKVLLKPAKEGTGLIASLSVRSVLELAGIRNVYTKSLGSNTPQNVILATMKALEEMPSKEKIMELRDLKEL